MRRKIIVHPWFIGLFPVLFLYANNINQVAFSETLLPIGLALLMTGLMLLPARFVLKNDQKAAIIVSIFLILCFSYGHVYQIISNWTRASFIIQRGRYLMGFWVLLFLSGFWLTMRTKRELTNQTSLFNIISLSLVLISLVNIGVYKLRTVNKKWDIAKSQLRDDELIDSGKSDFLPDIYYIVLDRYASEAVLREFYGYDNQEFTDYLKSKGFYVASESKANYPVTSHSLSSTLNMEYNNYLSEDLGEESNDYLPLLAMIRNCKACRLLKLRGYKFINSSQVIMNNQYADMNLNWYPITEFSMMLFKTTLFYPFHSMLSIFDDRLMQWKRIQYIFEKLEEIARVEGPKFVFVHMLVPHDPYVFSRNGEFLSREEENEGYFRDNYINQLIFINKKTKQLLDRLLSDTKNPPVIVLQSDEGPYPSRYPDYNFQAMSAGELREKMGILNAYYLPNEEKDVLYPSITPVNSFRLIFNLYFGAHYELLPDESYIFTDEKHPYKFINVTNKLR